VVKLPSPKIVEEKFYQLQGLYTDQDSKGWETVWRNFRASLFHLSLHVAFSDFRGYAPWARAKDVGAATFAVSLVLLHYAPIMGLVFLFISIWISLGAVVGRYHYALDVLAGAATALIVFAACYSYL